MSEKKVPVVCYSRVVGYLSATFLWNKGKQQEFKERKTYSWGKAVAKSA
jgi:anaerobic ribonucleoside-triphosphate reductase